MAEGPTTFNGPLHSDEASTQATEITAYFATAAQAQATRDALVSNGIAVDRIVITDATAQAADLAPADHTIIGKIREAILPDDSSTATRAAVKEGMTILAIVPDGDAERIIATIQAGHPSRFDADLERWRNSPPSA